MTWMDGPQRRREVWTNGVGEHNDLREAHEEEEEMKMAGALTWERTNEQSDILSDGSDSRARLEARHSGGRRSPLDLNRSR